MMIELSPPEGEITKPHSLIAPTRYISHSNLGHDDTNATHPHPNIILLGSCKNDIFQTYN